MLAVFFRYIRLTFLHLLLIFALLSCTTTKKEYQTPPEWVFGNINSNNICYVGSSRPHIRGLPYQRALAVSRAIEGIARQKNITVKTRVENYMNGTYESSSSFLKTYSIQTTSGEKISAQIKETWLNEKTSELFILMCEE